MCGSYMNKELMAKFNKISKTEERFHIHIYFDPGTPSEKAAQKLIEELKAYHSDKIETTGRVGTVGPHTKPNLEADTAVLNRWDLTWILQTIELAAKRDGLSVLVHQDTNSFLKDHTEGALWFGKEVPFNPAFVARFTPPKNDGPKAA